MRRDILERRSCIEKWIEEHRPKAFMCRELRCKQSTLDEYLTKMGLIYSGNRGGKGKTSPTRKNAHVFLRKGSLIKSYKLKIKLLEDRVKEKCCERCRKEEWLGEPIPLELHHMNGDPFDNRIENLQILCPNCHALTDNHAGRGMRIQKMMRQN
jgi:Zn finger protein HypA/HybF involved in hydrogenase expression